MNPDHTIKRTSFHYYFKNDNKPVLQVKPGETVKCEVNDVSHLQITRKSNAADIPKIDLTQVFPLAGPIYVEGAKSGDSLVVDILSVKASDYGWSAVQPAIDPFYALVMEGVADSKGNYLHIWDLSNRKVANFKSGIKVPIRPFCGTIGVAPEENGNPDAKSGHNKDGKDLSAWKFGGNMDIRHLTDGSKLILPISVDGALFSCGDLHATQGDGELGSAIESPGEITLRFGVEKKTIPNPRFITSKKADPEESYFGTTGNAPELLSATKQAARNMIEYLMSEFDLAREEAYMLCGVAADLRIHQCVNAPNWTVGLMMPKSVLGMN